MKSLFISFLAVILFVPCASGQNRKAVKYAKTITLEELNESISTLASDAFEGRATGERGQKMAADYIANKFQIAGLTPPVKTNQGDSFFQEFHLYRSRYNTSYFKKGDEMKKNLVDFLYYSRMETMGEEYIELVFCGDIKDFDLRGLDVKGKFIAFSAEEMTGWRSKLVELENSEAAGYFIVVRNEDQYRYALNRFGVVMIGEKIEFSVDDMGTKTIIANPALAEWIFEQSFQSLLRKGRGLTKKIIFNADMLIETIDSENVLGFVSGSEKPEEVVIVSAHYDHLGVKDGNIYNGADDNASGTSAIIEIAEAFAEAKENGDGPKRSVMFIAFSGEEEGLLGSRYYVTNPEVPLSNTVANLNIDMIGRQDLKYSEDPNYIYIIGSDRISTELDNLAKSVNEEYSTKLRLDYRYNDYNDPNQYYKRSDHYSFAQNNIPIIFYFSGTHGDYHQPTDTVDKINFEKVKKITDYIFFTTWEIANREERIRPD
tara:strand:+ start:179 stop:1639 length:1461 start_codon:yes stop_codon:yes gene_type:complete